MSKEQLLKAYTGPTPDNGFAEYINFYLVEKEVRVTIRDRAGRSVSIMLPEIDCNNLLCDAISALVDGVEQEPNQ